VTENRHGLLVNVRVTQAYGQAEREAALAMAKGPRTAGSCRERGHDPLKFGAWLDEPSAQNTSGRRSAVDGRTVRHEGYGLSQRARKRVEQVFGWLKTVAGLRKVRWRGCEKVGWMVTLAAAAYKLVRMRNLMAAAA